MSQEKIHVLLVEDEEAHAELVRRAFEPQSNVIRLSVAKSLKEARESLTESLPDLAIVDLFLPDGRGLELLSEKEDDEPDYPVLIMTSHGDEEIAVEAMKAGALQYVVKTEVALAELPTKVEGALRQWGHIVERRQAEEALQASEEHFRSLIENAYDVILVVDREGRVDYASPSLERVLGVRPDEQVGRSFLDVVHPEDREAAKDLLAKAFEQEEPVHLEHRSPHKDGTWRDLETIASSHHLARQDEERAILNSRDQTERRRAEAAKNELAGRLRHLQNWEIVANLAGDIAREFINVLSPIEANSTMVLQETPEGSKTRAGLERVLTATSRARELAERIFIFSRRTAPQAQAVELPEIVRVELERIEASLPYNIELRQDLDATCAAVLADPDQIREVMRSLASNAVKAMRDGGVLEVSLNTIEMEESSEPGALPAGIYDRLTFRDTGHGMDRVTLEQALKPFFTTRGAGEAAGLGLSVAHAIVTSHGGDLVIQSEAGKGTTIHVDLPQA